MTTTIRKNIFISYRVKDTQVATGRLIDALKQHISENQIFMDIDKIEPGLDFTQVISKYLNSSEIMLAIIGPDWMAYNAEKQTYRINDNNDWVRKEIATALQRNIRVIPILIDGGTMPEEEQLPDDLKPLLLRQAYEISNKRWKYDCDQLIETLKRTLGEETRQKNEFQKTNHFSNTAQTPKKENRNNKKYLIIAVAVPILVVLMQLFSGKDNDKVEPLKPEPIVADTAIPSIVTPSVDGPVAVSIKNIGGKWYDPNGKGTFIITQDDDNLMLKAYGINGQQTGQGSGYIKGNEVLLQITITADDLVIPSEFKLRLSEQETEMNGDLKIEQNGASYSEKVHLEKQ